jgi:hypothetical protein
MFLAISIPALLLVRRPNDTMQSWGDNQKGAVAPRLADVAEKLGVILATYPVISTADRTRGRLGLRGTFPLDPPRRNPVMKAWSVISLLFTAAILSTMPVSPQVTPRGVELSVDQAQAQATYGRYRRVTRRAYRRAGYAVAPGYGATAAGYGYGGAVYGYGGAGYRVEAAGYGRWCNVYPSGFRWCWTDYGSGYSGLNPQPLPPQRAALNPQPLPPSAPPR